MRTRSVAVAPTGSSPVILNPTTSGMSIEIGWPSIAASASIPPTPHPTTPSPLIIGVWESVPTRVSGYASAPERSFRVKTTGARCSRFTWWQIPVPGGTTRKLRNDSFPHRRNAYRSPLRPYSFATLSGKAVAAANRSTCTEWSITRSAGISGLIRFGSPPIRFAASRIAARSTSAGTPVKSCRSTRAGRKAISRSDGSFGDQFASARMSSAVTVAPSSWRRRFSRRTLMEKGRRETLPTRRFSSASRRKIPKACPPTVLLERVPKLSGCMASRPPARYLCPRSR